MPVLYVYTIDNDLFHRRYLPSVEQLKLQKEMNNNKYQNAGFDLFMPDFVNIEPHATGVLVGLSVKCAMFSHEITHPDSRPLSFYMYPRSSISKSSLRMSNNVGIIDSGYRGEIKAAVDNISRTGQNVTLSSKDRLFQLCSPTLEPLDIRFVTKERWERDFANNGTRGEGGFGSTNEAVQQTI